MTGAGGATALTDQQVRDFAARLERGQTCITHEAEALGVERSELRRALNQLCGVERAKALIKLGWKAHIGSHSRAKRRGGSAKQPNYALALERPKLDEGAVVEVPLGKRRVLLVSVLDGTLIRLASGHRFERAATEAVSLGGSVVVPADRLDAVLRAVRKAIRGQQR